MLARIFHESDLFVAEVVRAGLLDGLGAADLAALVSTLVYEHRSSEPPPRPWFSNDQIRGPWQRTNVLRVSMSTAAPTRPLPQSPTPGWQAKDSPRWSTPMS